MFCFVVLFGLSSSQVTSLPEPYGTCGEINPVPVSECHLNCKMEKVIEACGCHDVYMKQLDHENCRFSNSQENLAFP